MKKVLYKIFGKIYIRWGMIQLYKGNPVICGDSIKNLGKFYIFALNEQEADKIAFDRLHKIYPEYKDFLQLW